MLPRLKGAEWERTGDEVRVVYDLREEFVLDDPDGTVERLLELLRAGGRSVGEIATSLGVAEEDVAEAVGLLDEHRLLEDGLRLGGLAACQVERHHGNLLFLESFSTLARSHEDLHRRVTEAHVLALGTGGLNSNTIPHLSGLGVGRLTLVDRDVVEPRNFARQYLYRHRDIGRRKVGLAADWVREFDPAIEVNVIDRSIDGVPALAYLLERTVPDVVMSGIDRPAQIDAWVNAACVAAGVPFVRAGMWVTQGSVWSVDPGVSACRECARQPTASGPAGPRSPPDGLTTAERLQGDRPLANRAIGPVVGLLGAYAAFEVLRYLTRFEAPAYAGRPLVIDFAAGCSTGQVQWQRRHDCPVCGGGPTPMRGGDRHEAPDPADRERTPDPETL